jgi:hypothetical protein
MLEMHLDTRGHALDTLDTGFLRLRWTIVTCTLDQHLTLVPIAMASTGSAAGPWLPITWDSREPIARKAAAAWRAVLRRAPIGPLWSERLRENHSNSSGSPPRQRSIGRTTLWAPFHSTAPLCSASFTINAIILIPYFKKWPKTEIEAPAP